MMFYLVVDEILLFRYDVFEKINYACFELIEELASKSWT